MHRAAIATACLAIAVACAVLLAIDPAQVQRPRWPR